MNASKEQIVNLLEKWINQRAGLEFCDYGDRASYMRESRHITKQGKDAKTLLRAVEMSQITAEELTAAFCSYSGRLTLTEKNGEYRLDYCTGQYFPTEYRAAACAVLSSALWEYYREEIPAETENKGEALRTKFRRLFGKSIADRWFN